MTGETGERIGFAHGRIFLQRGVISKAITKAISNEVPNYQQMRDLLIARRFDLKSLI